MKSYDGVEKASVEVLPVLAVSVPLQVMKVEVVLVMIFLAKHFYVQWLDDA